MTGESSGGFIFDTGQDTQASFITPLSESGTINVNTWAATDLSVDVIGYFTAPTRTYRYAYDTTGLRASKSLDDGGVAGAGWTKEFTWDTSGGLPLVLAEHRGAQTSYLVYGPQGTPIYQVTATGDVMYFHQDHLGSTRLVTNANGTTKGTLTYSAYGKIKTNTVPWLQEQPLLGYNGQYHDPETGYIYLRARYLDPATGQFTTVDPLVALTEEPYGYVSGNAVNWTDPSGLGECFMGICNPLIEGLDWFGGKVKQGWDATCEWVREHPDRALAYAAVALAVTPFALSLGPEAVVAFGTAATIASIGSILLDDDGNKAARIAGVILFAAATGGVSGLFELGEMRALARMVDGLVISWEMLQGN